MSTAGPGTGWDHVLKLLIIGDSGVGKSSILLRFCTDAFDELRQAARKCVGRVPGGRAALRLGGGSCVHVSSRSGRRACGLRCGVVCERAGRTRVRFLLPPRGWRTRAPRAPPPEGGNLWVCTPRAASPCTPRAASPGARCSVALFFWFLARCCAGSWGALGQACAAGRSCEARAAPRPARSLSDSLRCS